MSDVETDSVEQAVADLFLASTVGRSNPSDPYDCGGLPECSCCFQNRHSPHPLQLNPSRKFEMWRLACLNEYALSLEARNDSGSKRTGAGRFVLHHAVTRPKPCSLPHVTTCRFGEGSGRQG